MNAGGNWFVLARRFGMDLFFGESVAELFYNGKEKFVAGSEMVLNGAAGNTSLAGDKAERRSTKAVFCDR